MQTKPKTRRERVAAAKQKIMAANHEINRVNERHPLIFVRVIPQPLCTYCRHHWVDYTPDSAAGCLVRSESHYEQVGDSAYIKEYGYTPNGDSFTYVQGECGGFDPKEGWEVRLERLLKDYYKGLVEKVEERSMGTLLGSPYSIARWYDPHG